MSEMYSARSATCSVNGIPSLFLVRSLSDSSPSCRMLFVAVRTPALVCAEKTGKGEEMIVSARHTRRESTSTRK